MSRVPKKADFMTISIYIVLAAFLIYFSAALGACFDCALDENADTMSAQVRQKRGTDAAQQSELGGKADFDKLAKSFESTLMNTNLVFEKIGEGGKAAQFPIFAAFHS